MPLRCFVLRFTSLVALAVWLGGFTFYSAVVIPVLHDALGVAETGDVTRQVTDTLNRIGLVALGIWWTLIYHERGCGPRSYRRFRNGFAVSTTLLLVVLVALHQIMDARLAGGSLRDFYPLHRLYLIASTVQWFLNLGLVGTTLVLWHAGRAVAEGRPRLP